MKKYFRGYISYPLENYVATTAKAIGFTVAGGYTSANDSKAWFPKSQIIIGKPNNVGVAEILIPYWLVKQKSNNAVDYFYRLREIRTENEIIVER